MTTTGADRAGSRRLTRTMKYCSRCGAAVSLRVPADDNRERWICDQCDTVHYQNPLIVVGCVAAKNDKVLLCKRAIEPRYGYWTVPAGFMEIITWSLCVQTLSGGRSLQMNLQRVLYKSMTYKQENAVLVITP